MNLYSNNDNTGFYCYATHAVCSNNRKMNILAIPLRNEIQFPANENGKRNSLTI